MPPTPGGFAWESVPFAWNAKVCFSLAEGCQYLTNRIGVGTQGKVSTFSKRGKMPSIGIP